MELCERQRVSQSVRKTEMNPETQARDKDGGVGGVQSPIASRVQLTSGTGRFDKATNRGFFEQKTLHWMWRTMKTLLVFARAASEGKKAIISFANYKEGKTSAKQTVNTQPWWCKPIFSLSLSPFWERAIMSASVCVWFRAVVGESVRCAGTCCGKTKICPHLETRKTPESRTLTKLPQWCLCGAICLRLICIFFTPWPLPHNSITTNCVDMKYLKVILF